MEWTDEVIARLRILWSEGLSTAEIGRRLNISKNAVVGKAHRLNLPSRPSPIRRGGTEGRASRRNQPRRAQGPTLPPLVSASVPVLPPSRPLVAAVPKTVLRAAPCCWPIGEPGTPSFRFCSDVSIPGKPYCETHAAVAYVRIRDRRDEVA